MVMKSICALACLLCLTGTVGADAAGSHPIEKVIKLLEGLKAKSTAEGKNEAVAYQKFAYWCSSSITTLTDAMNDEKEKIAELEDLLAGKKKERDTLENDIDTLEGEIGDMEASAKKAKDTRKDEEDLYKKALDNVKKTIQAVNDAMKAMTSAEGSTELVQKGIKKVLALISIDSSVSEEQMSGLQAFADPKKRPKQLAAGDLDKHVDTYDFKSENVIELLKSLKSKFQDDKLAMTKAETNSVNAYNVAKEARDNAMKAANKSKDKKTTTLGKVKKTIADADKNLKDQEADLKADSKGHKDTKQQCAKKKGQWEDRSKTRELEISAIGEAQKILGDATGVRTEAPGNPVPPPSPVKFLQIASSSSPKMSAVAVIREAGQRTHSRALERLAVEVSAHLSGPFDQVNNMIEKMIFRLMDEQKQEDEHKHWCDQELKKTNVMKDDKTDKLKNLNAEIKKETSTVSELTEEIKTANDMIKDIIAFKGEAVEIRAVGKKENKLAVDDSETAQKALANAIAVLNDFYKSSGMVKKEPWEFIQAPVKLPENPKTWGSSYTGVADPVNQDSGIITVLETVMADFANMEAESKAQEASDQEEFDQSMSDNDIEMSRRQQEADMKSDEKKRRNSNISSLNEQKKNTESELEKTDQYLLDLQPACVSTDKGASYDSRKDARSDEIKALKQAQVILLDAFKEKTSGKFLQVHRA